MTRLASDNALSVCLQGRFSSKFLCLTEHAGAFLCGTYSLSAQTKLSETLDSTLPKISFFTWNRIEIYINYKRKIIMSNDQLINKKYLQSYKKNCNLEEFYIIINSFYTKVSRIKRLTIFYSLSLLLSVSWFLYWSYWCLLGLTSARWLSGFLINWARYPTYMSSFILWFRAQQSLVLLLILRWYLQFLVVSNLDLGRRDGGNLMGTDAILPPQGIG